MPYSPLYDPALQPAHPQEHEEKDAVCTASHDLRGVSPSGERVNKLQPYTEGEDKAKETSLQTEPFGLFTTEDLDEFIEDYQHDEQMLKALCQIVIGCKHKTTDPRRKRRLKDYQQRIQQLIINLTAKTINNHGNMLIGGNQYMHTLSTDK